MIKSRIRIGIGPIWDMQKKFGLIYIEADNRTEAPVKERESSSYAEEAGEHTDPRTVQSAFDYSAKFLVECPNHNFVNANSRIAEFNKSLYDQTSGSDIRRYKEITFYNDYKRVKITGLPDPMAEPKEFFRCQDGRMLDYAVVELKIRASDPRKCDFDMSRHIALGTGTGLRIRTESNKIITMVEEFIRL